jgi:hypothetical protein
MKDKNKKELVAGQFVLTIPPYSKTLNPCLVESFDDFTDNCTLLHNGKRFFRRRREIEISDQKIALREGNLPHVVRNEFESKSLKKENKKKKKKSDEVQDTFVVSVIISNLSPNFYYLDSSHYPVKWQGPYQSEQECIVQSIIT